LSCADKELERDESLEDDEVSTVLTLIVLVPLDFGGLSDFELHIQDVGEDN
jgi:hypothetical protein